MMGRGRLTLRRSLPARPGALVVMEGSDLPDPIAREARRQFERSSVAVIPSLGLHPANLLVVLKPPAGDAPEALTRAWGAAGRKLVAEGVTRATAVVPENAAPDNARPLVLGLGRALYRFERYQENPSPLPKVGLVSPSPAWSRQARAAFAVLEGVLLTRDLVNTPAEDMGPAELEAAARDVARSTGMKIRVLSAARCRKMGMGALTAVGRASTREPRMIVLEHRGRPRERGFFAFAGKGIVFDTGGLDLKPPAGMLLMKKDMGGAATVLGAALALGGLKVRHNLRFYLAVAENAVAGNAIRPGDVITALDGTTIEIANTDAEGRLVLADAIALAVREGAHHVLDAATLTGAAMIALGRIRVPMMANRDDFAARLEAAADRAGERVWRLPMDPEYRDQVRSKIAVLKNVGKGREAGTIAAGVFLEHFAAGRPWAHLDISPASWSDSAGDLGPEGATGTMVPTLTSLIEAL
ncbi:MAG: leucyl aminopeptidase family protein [Acidobacteriota bacterium]|nr:leucyl aminopeptidase family protein [Acidobacteriota bacterium]MDQ7086886.1 leucyl aminopeptidase family protein [Acidobacteriota bacterium]